MKTPTEKLLEKLAEWKAGYREIILAGRPEDTEFEAGQYRRLTTIECYLEERMGR